MNENLWEKVGNSCLNKADEILQIKTVPSAEQVRTVKELVDIAIAIDVLNLRWAEQNQFSAENRAREILNHQIEPNQKFQ